MKKSSIKWLIGMFGVLLLILIGILGHHFWSQPSEPPSMFTYEFMWDESALASVKMSIMQVEGLEYSITPMGEIVISEPTPDWGIHISFTEDHSNGLYFYTGYSRSDQNSLDNETEINHVTINGKEMSWQVYGGRVSGTYLVSDGHYGSYRIAFHLEESWWNKNKKLVIDIIESAQVGPGESS